ncbi:MAG: sulfur-carrier protein adenylyltransferase/sulfurtransferase [Candidatus Sumerlaeota bacterium]|nr:sulfur-carrier protein adenylyltransferase/sulfurtransferase [Candidatus Sumerlaeota bacterium]
MTDKQGNLPANWLERYSRNILLPGVGGRGQRRLLAARVAVVGLGGLGSPAALYLAASGVGTLDLIDSDAVELSNLQRQILHGTPDLGRPKTASAGEALARLNPGVHLNLHAERLDSGNAAELLGKADVILDGSDNFATRYLVNETAVRLGRPLVTASLFRFEGQAAVFLNAGGPEEPCYRCLFPVPPPAGALPSCQEAGILGSVAGLLGTIQATEALKLLLGIGEPLTGRVLGVDALSMEFTTLRVRRNPACPLHGAESSMLPPFHPSDST